MGGHPTSHNRRGGTSAAAKRAAAAKARAAAKAKRAAEAAAKQRLDDQKTRIVERRKKKNEPTFGLSPSQKEERDRRSEGFPDDFKGGNVRSKTEEARQGFFLGGVASR